MTSVAPRLRVERLVIVESRSPLRCIRDVRLHGGLNVVWAEELAATGGGSEVQRAGHGVGKSTFSLMLRAVLGDDGVAVRTMRSHLAEHYGNGGIAAEVVAGVERFSVFRSFGMQSFALRDATVEQLLEEGAKDRTIEFSAYVKTLGEQACLQYMATHTLPVTGQTVEWNHVLCWLARDQALGLRQYFEWRNDDGTGLRRKVKDPPALTRLVLGLLSNAEVEAEASIAGISTELASARDAVRNEEQRGANTRAIVETQLRLWARVSPSLAMDSDDLFASSVMKVASETTNRIKQEIEEARASVDTLDLELIDLATGIKEQRRSTDLAKARWDEALALKSKDDTALNDARGRRNLLLQLPGSCDYGAISYSLCSYVQQQLDSTSFATGRKLSLLTKSVKEIEEAEALKKAYFDQTAARLDELTKTQQQITERKLVLSRKIGERERQLGEGDFVQKTLAEWQEIRSTPETKNLNAARSLVGQLERALDSVKNAKVSAQWSVSERERALNARFSLLAEAFGAPGRYVPSDERRPFHMLTTGGDAYTVLEILLGDLACAVDGVAGGGSHPGFLVFDCPREREMGPQLYDRFLRLVDQECQAAPGLQVVLTTTTPPPQPLGDEPTRILKLSHASDDDLLLKRRIESLLTRVPPAVREQDEL